MMSIEVRPSSVVVWSVLASFFLLFIHVFFSPKKLKVMLFWQKFIYVRKKSETTALQQPNARPDESIQLIKEHLSNDDVDGRLGGGLVLVMMILKLTWRSVWFQCCAWAQLVLMAPTLQLAYVIISHKILVAFSEVFLQCLNRTVVPPTALLAVASCPCKRLFPLYQFICYFLALNLTGLYYSKYFKKINLQLKVYIYIVC